MPSAIFESLSSVFPFLLLALGLALLRHVPWARLRGRSGGTAPSAPGADGCNIAVVPVLNGEETRLARRLDALLAGAGGRLRLLAQVSLDEIFEVSGGRDRKARYGLRGTFSQKRVDFLLVDAAMRPVLGIEYHGSGHHRGNAARRDTVKARTFDRAGLTLRTIRAGYDWPREAEALRTLLDLPPDRA